MTLAEPSAPYPHAAPLNPDEVERLAALHACGVLDTSPEDRFDDLTALASRLTGCPIALVSLVDKDRQWFKSRLGMSACQTGRDVAFCAWVVHLQEPLLVPDALEDERFRNNPLVTGGPGIRMYAGFPLVVGGGHVVGSFCVADTRPRRLEDHQLKALGVLADQTASQLELRRSVRRLTEVQQGLERASAEARAACRAKTEFLANMSHEIRTPMTAILGFADLILGAPDEPEEVKDHARTIRRNGEHLLGIISEVLDLSKVESGKLVLASEACALRDVLLDAVGCVRTAAEAKGLALSLAIDPGVPPVVRTDPTRVRQVILNLVGNAVKFTESGRVDVRAAVRTDGAGSVLEVRVRDTGPGIPADRVGRLFQAFELVDASASRRHAGTGLGLCISRHLCRLMGGDVTVATAAGEGSEFTATFRVEPVAGAAGPAEEMEEERRPLEGVRVLLIEDGPDNQRLLRHVLTRAGADVDVRADGPSGLGRVLEPAAGEWAPDVILMDVQMPGMDGYEATRRLRKAGVRTPIVALTAHAMMGERERCLLAGCDDYQTKPIDRARLLACCKRRAGAAAVARAGEHASARA